MAIMEDLGIEVCVLVNGAPAAEYPVPDPAVDSELAGARAGTSQKYVECVDNALFAVRCTVDERSEWLQQGEENTLSFTVHIDGTRMRSKHLRPKDLQVGGDGKRQCVLVMDSTKYLDKEAGEYVKRKFRFSAISTVDDAEKNRVEKDAKVASKLGRIRVLVRRRLYTGRRDAVQTRDIGHHDSFTLAEKALKGRALSHGTSLDPPTRTTKSNWAVMDDVDSPTHPYTVFDFLYRSQDALKKEMIIPRSPSPPTLNSLNVDDLSTEELRRLARERLQQIKAEKDEPGRPAKREFGGTIDLTTDNSPPRPLKAPKKARTSVALDLTDG